jgi:prephenate dehydratase
LIKVAFQGEFGAYSEEALRLRFGDSCEPIPCETFRQVFEKITNREVNFAVIPVENSIAGPVEEPQQLLREYRPKIEGEIRLRVRHCLLGYPGSSLQTIKKVISHPQALAQSKKFLAMLSVSIEPFYDTAGAAKWVSTQKKIDVAAVANCRAAERYGLIILKEGIESDSSNITRFLIIQEHISVS